MLLHGKREDPTSRPLPRNRVGPITRNPAGYPAPTPGGSIPILPPGIRGTTKSKDGGRVRGIKAHTRLSLDVLVVLKDHPLSFGDDVTQGCTIHCRSHSVTQFLPSACLIHDCRLLSLGSAPCIP